MLKAVFIGAAATTALLLLGDPSDPMFVGGAVGLQLLMVLTGFVLERRSAASSAASAGEVDADNDANRDSTEKQPDQAGQPHETVSHQSSDVAGGDPTDEEMGRVIGVLAEGDFSVRHANPDAPINAVIAQIQTAVEEAIALAELMSCGDLSTRANGVYKGDVRQLGRDMNTLQDRLVAMISNASDVATQIANQGGEVRKASSAMNSTLETSMSDINGVTASVDTLHGLMGRISVQADETIGFTSSAQKVVNVGRSAADEATQSLAQMENDAKEIAGILGSIEAISKQTNLLAINASVEAARAGRAGAGFAIVSEEVKALAIRSGEASGQIREIVDRTRVSVGACSERIANCARLMDEISSEVDQAGDSTQKIEALCQEQGNAMDQTRQSVAGLQQGISVASRSAHQMAQVAEGFDLTAAHLHSVLSSFVLSDETMVADITARAAEVSRRFETGIRTGRISKEALFSRDYEPVPGIEPAQFTTSYTDFTDQVVTDVIEDALSFSDDVIFCAPINVDGFIPTHNKKFAQAPRSDDPVFNAGNARNRRFFTDRVGLAGGRSTAPCLVQSYRRDMGGGNFVTMKDISAPIFVDGQHWGGLRMGYRAKTAVAADTKPAQAA